MRRSTPRDFRVEMAALRKSLEDADADEGEDAEDAEVDRSGSATGCAHASASTTGAPSVPGKHKRAAKGKENGGGGAAGPRKRRAASVAGGGTRRVRPDEQEDADDMDGADAQCAEEEEEDGASDGAVSDDREDDGEGYAIPAQGQARGGPVSNSRKAAPRSRA